MRILVAVATRHGATREIAEHLATSLGSALTGAGVAPEVEVRDVGLVASLDGFDAVVLGSARYLGRWLEPARKFAESFSDDLRGLPLWLFSSGPVGERPEPEDRAAIDDLVRRLGARQHRVFGGRIDRQALRLPERLAVTALPVTDGDFRDWPSIRAWGCEIGATLAAAAVAGSTS
ncbi:flavodoxin domain-containing protein [Amycolatopsis sp. lyj-346]|uniref:flavodoxin domain-containing protein n=1 Tax=Amycolatopsis sp. lyj-346 TaxID=2789289 RepID=UPI00397AB073